MPNSYRIGQIAPLWIPVPPRAYGGTELVVSNLVENLVGNKHEVTLFASGDSVTNAKLVAILENAIWVSKNIRNPHAPIARMLKLVQEQFSQFDILHNHFGFFSFPLTLFPNCPPMLTTIHNPLDEEYAAAMRAYPNIHFCAISEDHKLSLEEKGVPVAGVVYNGIDVDKYTYQPEPGKYLFYLGRLNREKGVLDAIETARRTGQEIVIAGNTTNADESHFFIRKLQPLFSEPGVHFRGPVRLEEKVELLRGAKALLCPFDRREPFGLVMTEAMACGTPVIAYGNGSVPEIVEDGKTGFVVKDLDEMVTRVKDIDQIDRLACHIRARDKFGIKQMIEGYEQLYAKILASS